MQETFDQRFDRILNGMVQDTLEQRHKWDEQEKLWKEQNRKWDEVLQEIRGIKNKQEQSIGLLG